LSTFENRETIAVRVEELSTNSRKLVEKVVRTEVRGKNVINDILHLYQQLRIKLEGSRTGKYSTNQLEDAREELLKLVEKKLKDLQDYVIERIKEADETAHLSRKVHADLFRAKTAVMAQSDRIRLESWWEWIFKVFKGEAITASQLEALSNNSEIAVTGMGEVVAVKKNLIALLSWLQGFDESILAARDNHRMATSMNLTVEDLLASLDGALAESKIKMSEWQISGS
jgi:uncharacterized protein YxjI